MRRRLRKSCTGQPRSRATRWSRRSGFTACGNPTASKSGRSLIESLYAAERSRSMPSRAASAYTPGAPSPDRGGAHRLGDRSSTRRPLRRPCPTRRSARAGSRRARPARRARPSPATPPHRARGGLPPSRRAPSRSGRRGARRTPGRRARRRRPRAGRRRGRAPARRAGEVADVLAPPAVRDVAAWHITHFAARRDGAPCPRRRGTGPTLDDGVIQVEERDRGEPLSVWVGRPAPGTFPGARRRRTGAGSGTGRRR